MDYIYLYHNFIQEVFTYLKKTILVDFPSMKLDINYDTVFESKYAGNIFNKITVYMGVRMKDQNFYNVIYMKNQILYSLFHESIHQLEFTDPQRYVSDRKYKMNVERNVDYTTMHYINDNNLELQRIFNIIVYEYNIDTLSNHYDKGGVIINRNNIDMKYFNKLINKFIDISNIQIYNMFMKYGRIRIHFVLNNESLVDQYTIRDDFVLDFEKMNTIMVKYMYQGYVQRIYRGTLLEKKDEVIFSIFMNNDNIKFMERG